MKYLLYCIFRQEFQDRDESGVISGHGLAAAASPYVEPTDVPELLRFAEVISRFHAQRTVVPLRYGCVLPSREAVLDLLAGQGARFQALLSKLDGMEEMGLRVLCPAAPASPPALPSAPGAGYLAAARRRQEAQGHLLTAREAELADRFHAALRGLSAEERRQARLAADGRMLALDFLVPRASLGLFRERIAQAELPPYLLTGPWPPYNFVDFQNA